MSNFTVEQALQQALAYHQAGQIAQAEVLYRQVLAVQPHNHNALHLLGMIAGQVGQIEAAVELIARAVDQKGNEAVYHSDLGDALRCQGRLVEAVAHYEQAAALQPEAAEVHYHLGNAYFEQQRLEESAACFERAIAIRPDYMEAHNNLGNIYALQGCQDKAIACYERAIASRVDHPEMYNNLGNIFWDQGRLDEAVACFHKAIALRPDFRDAHNNLGNAFKDQGRLDEAIASYEKALTIPPVLASIHSNLIHILHYHPDSTIDILQNKYEEWEQQHGEPRRRFNCPHANTTDPERRLKIGYVSPDLRQHPVGRFLLPLLENHSRIHYEITCYADVIRPDAVTEQLRGYSDQWRMTSGLSEEQLASQISEDAIDILVDLAQHTAGNRLPVFARKPAPVQVTYIGYAGATGLHAMDYCFTDAFLAQASSFSSEQAIPLPQLFLVLFPFRQRPVREPSARARCRKHHFRLYEQIY